MFKQRHQDDDELTEDEDDATIDPELRLRTVRTAASTLTESIAVEQRAQRRRTMAMNKRKKGGKFFRRAADRKRPESVSDSKTEPPTVAGSRRNIYVNCPISSTEADANGEPIVRYPRNKVRTSKYTILTFVPKNLFEQFRRVANIYFLALVVLQVFPVFGAASPQTAALPLIFIISVTAIKDGVEDYRRATLDEEVNNSAATKLGDWRNVNQPIDPRAWFERLLGLNLPGKVTKGIRKLREREAGEGMQIILTKTGSDSHSVRSTGPGYESSIDLVPIGSGGRRLEDIQSIDSHSYPPGNSLDASRSTLIGGPAAGKAGYSSDEISSWNVTGSISSLAPVVQHSSTGVVDYRKRTTGQAKWERTLWKKLEVGDIVLLRDNDQIPADIVVLSTSDSEGVCFVETKNLDGETNLKPRKSVQATANIVSEEDLEKSTFIMDCEPPHQNLYVHHGVLRYTDIPTGQIKQESITINELLLRGCTVRNTDWIIGLVVYTGADSKIMLNGGATPSKRSKIEKETNFNVIVNFIVLMLMCLVTAVCNGIWESKSGTSADVFEVGAEDSSSVVVNSVITFTTCLIAFQNIVPISLYISIEIVKTIQAFFISQDIGMYYKPFDTACVPKTWNISDDLGQIEYVFSDKTGTLTQNIMEFQKCSVNGVAYGEGVTEAQRGAAKREGRVDAETPEEQSRKIEVLRHTMLQKLERSFKNRYAQPDRLTLVSPQLAEDLTNRESEQRAHIMAFFRALAICHTVLSDRPTPRDNPYFLNYKAESPDEAALVAAACDVGFPFVSKGKDFIDIEALGQTERYVPLKIIEFNSTRKRMSVIVRNPQGRLVLYCKGADSVIYERLAADHDPILKEKTSKDMETFANGGLRTLCIAYRYLGETEYMEWSQVYDAATSTINDREEEIDKANEQIEHSLHILGATALEDKLQEGVPDAIETLHQAGIKLWILTGDKVQTAIEIGFSCNLLKNNMDVMIIQAHSLEDARSKIEAGCNKIASVLGMPSWEPKKRGFIPGAQAAFAVVIDGETLSFALKPELKTLFLNLATQCETVVCCRVSPAQKASVVKLVKEGRKAMTLSIGDGANDVAMIQEANIGCGLFGLEGSQAAMSADYAFGQFRFLTKLLIVHGRWSYQRIADMHSNFFYKNVIWTFAMFWFLPYNNFDATYLYQYTFILLYNVVFTSLPVIVLGAFDQDVNAQAALAFPQLYIRGIRGLEYTKAKFWAYMLDGLYQSVVVFFIPYVTWTLGNVASWNGRTIESLSDFGTTVSVAAIFAANSYVGINTRYWTVLTWIVVIGSSVIMLLWIVIYSFFQSGDFNDEVVILFGNVIFWATVVVSVVIALAPRFLIKFVSTSYRPLDRDIVREMWVLGDLKDRMGIAHRKNRKRADVEATPMFHQPHARSMSEISVLYEPAPTRSPGVHGFQPANVLEYDSSPQYRRSPSSQGPSDFVSVEGMSTQQSYDSSPDVQPPLSGNPQNRAPEEPTPPLVTGSSSASRSPYPGQKALSNPGAYEMQVRDRSHHPPERIQEASGASYATAPSSWQNDSFGPESRSVTPGLAEGHQDGNWRHSEARAL